MASYVIFYAITNTQYNNYNYTLDKDSLWNSNSNKTFIKLIKSIRDRRQNHLPHCLIVYRYEDVTIDRLAVNL